MSQDPLAGESKRLLVNLFSLRVKAPFDEDITVEVDELPSIAVRWARQQCARQRIELIHAVPAILVVKIGKCISCRSGDSAKSCALRGCDAAAQ
jgi:hypothetical protein